MSVQPRFEFPGFALRAVQDTSTYEVEVGTIQEDGTTFVLTLVRKNTLTHLPFSVSKVQDSADQTLWDYRIANHVDSFSVMAMAGNKPVIAINSRGKYGKVLRVVPLSSLIGDKPTGLREELQLKKAAAEFLGMEFQLLPVEHKLQEADLARTRVEEEAARVAARAEREAAEAAALKERLQEKVLRIRAIQNRAPVTGYTASGQTRYGVPALESEWRSLHDGTFVMLVDSVGENGEVGNLIESFKVAKGGGKSPRKEFRASVTSKIGETPLASASVHNRAPQPLRSVFIETEVDAFEVQLFASMDQIREARKAGLNSGTFAAVDEVDAAGKIMVFSVHHDKIDTLGKFVPLA